MGLSSRHTEEETDRSRRTVEGEESKKEQEAMVRGRKREKGDEKNGKRWRDGCTELPEDRQMKGNA